MIALSNLNWTPGDFKQVCGRLERGNNPRSVSWSAAIDANNPRSEDKDSSDYWPWIEAVEANNPTG